MFEPDIVAMAAVIARVGHDPIGGGNDRRTPRRAEIHSGMHPGVAEQRVKPLTVKRGDAAVNRGQHPRAGLDIAGPGQRVGGIEPAVVAPAEQLRDRRVAAIEARIKQVAHLRFAGGGALVGEYQIERIARLDIVFKADVAVERLEIFLDCLRRCPGRAGRTIQAIAHRASNAQRGGINRNGFAFEPKGIAGTGDGQGQIEAGAEIEPFKRARLSGRRARAEHECNAGAGLDLVQRRGAANQRTGAGGIAARNPGAQQQAAKAVILGQHRSEFEAWPFGHAGDRAERHARSHAAACCGTVVQRHDRLAAEFRLRGGIEPHRRSSIEPRKIGPERQCADGEHHQRGHAAIPAAGADSLGKIRNPVYRGEAGAPVAAGGDDIGQGKFERRCCRARDWAMPRCIVVLRLEHLARPLSPRGARRSGRFLHRKG